MSHERELPITVNQDQLHPLYEILEVALTKDDAVLEIKQSRGPLMLWAVFVEVEAGNVTETWVVDHAGNKQLWKTEDNREPSDDEIYAREPMEPGKDEHDRSL